MVSNPTSGLFGDTGFTGSITPSVQVQNPVQNNGMADLFNSIDQGVQGASQLFAASAKNSAAAANSKVLVNFQQDVGKITDAMEQGMSLQEGRMRLRALNSQYISNYPTMVKDIDEMQGKLVSTVGLANVIATGSEDVQRQKKIADDASAAGWADVSSYQQHQQSVNQLAVTKTQLDQSIANYGIVTQGDKTKGYVALKGVIETGLPWVEGKISDYQNQIDSHQMDPDAAIAALNAEVAKETAFIGQARGLSGGADKDADPSFLLTGIQDRLKAFTDYNNGSITKDVYTNKLAAAKAMDEFAIRQQAPDLARAITLSNMLPPVASSMLLQTVSDKALEYLTKMEQGGSDPTTGQPIVGQKPQDLISNSPDVNSALAVANASIKKMGANPTPEQTTSIRNTITSVLNSAKTFGGTAGHPQEFNSVIDFLADPAVGAWMVKSGGVPKGAGDGASYTIQQEYGEVLLPLVRQRWDEANAGFGSPANGQVQISNTTKGQGPMAKGVENANLAGVVMPVWNGAAVEFRPSPGFEKNARVVALANSLNKGPDAIAGPLNTYIRAATHLQGSTDYQGFYTKNIAERLFNPVNPAPDNSKVPAGEKVSDLANGFKEAAPAFSQDNNGSDMTAGMSSYLTNIKKQESGGDPNIVNPRSGATGTYQFMKNTWTDLMHTYPNAGLTADGRTDPHQQEIAIRLFTSDNASYLQRHGVPTNPATLYAAHFLGAQGALPVLSAPDTDLVAEHVRPSVLIANPHLQGMTIAQFKRWAKSAAT